MSRAAARRLARLTRHTCRECQARPAKFAYRGEVRADRDHNLCFQCYRAETNRQRAQQMSHPGRLWLRMPARPARPAHAHGLAACA